MGSEPNRPFESPSAAVSDMARLSVTGLLIGKVSSQLINVMGRDLPSCGHQQERDETDPGEGTEHQTHPGPGGAQARHHLPHQVRDVEGDHEDDGDPVRQTAGLNESLHPRVEGEGDGVGESHGQHVRPDIAADHQASPHPSLYARQTLPGVSPDPASLPLRLHQDVGHHQPQPSLAPPSAPAAGAKLR